MSLMKYKYNQTSQSTTEENTDESRWQVTQLTITQKCPRSTLSKIPKTSFWIFRSTLTVVN